MPRAAGRALGQRRATGANACASARAGWRGPARTALVYIPGDPGGVSYRFAGGRPYVERASEHYELSPETRDTGRRC